MSVNEKILENYGISYLNIPVEGCEFKDLVKQLNKIQNGYVLFNDKMFYAANLEVHFMKCKTLRKFEQGVEEYYLWTDDNSRIIAFDYYTALLFAKDQNEYK